MYVTCNDCLDYDLLLNSVEIDKPVKVKTTKNKRVLLTTAYTSAALNIYEDAERATLSESIQGEFKEQSACIWFNRPAFFTGSRHYSVIATDAHGTHELMRGTIQHV